jgi:hypothetical protein
LFASIPVGFFVAALTGGWKDFKTALLATGMTLGCFIVWHILRAPWLLYRSVQTSESEPGTLAGLLGVAVIASVLFGGVELGRFLWAARPIGIIASTIKSPPPPSIKIYETVPPVKEQCWANNYALPVVQPWGLVTVVCNRTIKPPYTIEFDYDQGGLAVGPITFPVGKEFAKYQEVNRGDKIFAIFDLHSIIPNEPFSMMAKGPGDKFPLVKAGIIRAKGVVLEFHAENKNE